MKKLVVGVSVALALVVALVVVSSTVSAAPPRPGAAVVVDQTEGMAPVACASFHLKSTCVGKCKPSVSGGEWSCKKDGKVIAKWPASGSVSGCDNLKKTIKDKCK